jgi:hypothetical protein
MIWHKIFGHETRHHDHMNGQFSRGMTSHHRIEYTTERSWVEFPRCLTQGGLSTIKHLISSANQSDMGIDRDAFDEIAESQRRRMEGSGVAIRHNSNSMFVATSEFSVSMPNGEPFIQTVRVILTPAETGMSPNRSLQEL